MKAVEACGYEEDRSKDSVSNGEVGVEVFVGLGECESNAKCNGEKKACNSIFSRTFKQAVVSSGDCYAR